MARTNLAEQRSLGNRGNPPVIGSYTLIKRAKPSA